MDLDEFLNSRAGERRRKLSPYTGLIREMREERLATFEEIRLYLELAHSVTVGRTAIHKHCVKHGIRLGVGADASIPCAPAQGRQKQKPPSTSSQPPELAPRSPDNPVLQKTPISGPSFVAPTPSRGVYDKALASRKEESTSRDVADPRASALTLFDRDDPKFRAALLRARNFVELPKFPNSSNDT
jgi:hypothetical protein